MLDSAGNVRFRSSAQINTSFVQLCSRGLHPRPFDVRIRLNDGHFKILVTACHNVAVNSLPANPKVFKKSIQTV
jgi:hypothetical protein